VASKRRQAVTGFASPYERCSRRTYTLRSPSYPGRTLLETRVLPGDRARDLLLVARLLLLLLLHSISVVLHQREAGTHVRSVWATHPAKTREGDTKKREWLRLNEGRIYTSCAVEKREHGSWVCGGSPEIHLCAEQERAGAVEQFILVLVTARRGIPRCSGTKLRLKAEA
jgi:hypothetical protein